MATHGQNGSTQECVIEFHTPTDEGGPRLDGYLLKSTHKMNEMTELASRGEAVDCDSRAWMLAQVDFIIDSIGNEKLDLNDEMRSNLLQLLLAIANLNEHMRHQDFLTR
jgi:hypothetical protein